MQKVTFFYIQGCPYCANARKARAELIAENASYGDIEFDEIDEMAHPEISDNYDYQATPAMYIGEELIYQAHVGEPYEECKAHMKEVMDKALASA